MPERFCSRCATDVEDVGGFCLLGHRLAVEAALPSLGDLRAEVDKAFEEARASMANALATASGHPSAAASGHPRGAAPEPTLRSQSAPPPPPPTPDLGTTRPSVWTALEDSHDEAGDPIVAFAPAPRMDWGPERKARWRDRHHDA